MICKNEENNIGLLLEQLCPIVEEVHVTDTGSTDQTLSILAGKAAKYSNLSVHHFEWTDDFAAARNYSFSFATQEFCMFLDGDDLLADPAKFSEFKDKLLDNIDVDTWLFPYHYARHADGSPRLILSRERLIRRSLGRQWVGAIHECINISGTRARLHEDIVVVHNNAGKVRDWGRNVRILEKEFAQHPNDERTVFYYGKELFDRVDARGVAVLEHYLTLPYRYWDNEINARARLSRAYLAAKRHGDAIRVANEIYHLEPTRQRAEFYWIYGAVEHDLGNFQQAIPWFTRCTECVAPVDHMVDLEFSTWHPRKRLAECYHALKKYGDALRWVRETEAMTSGDTAIKQWAYNLRNIKLEPFPGHQLVTLEFGTQLRFDSYRNGEHFWASLDEELPFAPNSIDGVVVNRCTAVQAGRLRSIIKPGGFLWDVGDGDGATYAGFGYLGKSIHQKQQLRNWIKADDKKPILGFPEYEGTSIPQVRYRLGNTALSAVKNGFPIRVYSGPDASMPCDIYFALRLEPHSPGKVRVLEMCELLPSYDSVGVEYADVINVCSATLAEAISARFPDKKVINVDDHFEMPPSEWL